MLTRAELDFAEIFVAALSYNHVSDIPFGENRFQEGMARVSNFIDENAEQFKEGEKIKLLFIRKPITGTYERMLEALQYLNGSSISFALRNPSYETTIIKVPFLKAEKLLEDSNSDYPKELMLNVAEIFCNAAGVTH